METLHNSMDIRDIHTVSPFKDLFSINPKTLESIVADMQKNGFDEAQPVILWLGNKSILIDGHTRLEASKIAGIKEIPAIFKPFDDEAAALKYAIKCQRNRRNLTAEEILTCIREVDKLKQRGTPERNADGTMKPLASCEANGKSAQKTAEIVGVSRATVERARAVIDKATPEIKEAVKSGEMSINAAYNKTVTARKKELPPDFQPIYEREKLNQIAAKLTGASVNDVRIAARIKEENPAMFEQIKTGEVTCQQADLYLLMLDYIGKDKLASPKGKELINIAFELYNPQD